MSNIEIVPVILCGGSGTRLWPRSRVSKPKPFLPLVGERSLFEETVARTQGVDGFAPPVIVTGSAHLDHVLEQLGEQSGAEVIVEPMAKNTAAAIALAALRLSRGQVMLVCPSDHHIADANAFRDVAAKAAALAKDGWLVSFGIEAKSPETGFGYLQRGESIGDFGYRTARFVEKPDIERAQEFVADGNYAWNGGIFAFEVGAFLDELSQHRPDILEGAKAAVEAGRCDGPSFHPAGEPFASINGQSVDYAVMENTTKAALVPADMGWSDIGSWDAVQTARFADDQGNSVKGSADLVDCARVLVESDGPRVSVIGLSDVAIIVDGNDILVTTMEGAQKVGKLPGAANQ